MKKISFTAIFCSMLFLINCSDANKPDPCNCETLMTIKPDALTIVGFSDTEAKEWKKCREAYYGWAGAKQECLKKK